MRVCRDAAELRGGVRRGAAPEPEQLRGQRACSSRSSSSAARHIEVQIFGDGRGHVLALGERDCSAQRRNQKVVEETPAPGLRRRGARRAVRCGGAARRAVQLRVGGHGRVRARRATATQFYFLEVNTRLQVEHGVTEAVTGIDLVEWMVRQAAGELVAARSGARAARRARSRCASTPRIRTRTSSPAPARSPTSRCPRTRAVDALGRERHRGHAALRPAARQGHRARRRRARGALAAAARRARRRRASPASRPTSTTCARSSRERGFARGGVTTRYLQSFAYRAAHDRGARRPARRRRCRTTRAASATGPSACRRRGRWTTTRSGSPTAWSATPTARAALEITLSGPDAAFQRATP